MRSCQMTRMAALRRAKRRKRGTMPGDHRGQETHSPWFVFLCMVDCDIQYVLFVDYEYLAAGNISFSVHLYSSCSWFFFSFWRSNFYFLRWDICTMTCPFNVLFCTSWMLCQRTSSRRSREPFTSSPWSQVCQRPCSRPKNTPTAFGTRNLSLNWVIRLLGKVYILLKKKALIKTLNFFFRLSAIILAAVG